MKTVVGLYDELEDAREAVDELVEAGVPRSDISLVARDVTGDYGSYLNEYDEAGDVGEAAAGGAVGGAVVGGLTGLLVGLGALAIPGLGPVIAAGPLAAALAGAGIGAAAGGVLGALVEWGIPEAEAGYYAEGLRRGGTLLAVRIPENQVEDVVEIMNDYSPVDIERRAEHWRSEYGWETYDPNAAPYGAEEIESYRSGLNEWDDADYDSDLDVDVDVDSALLGDDDDLLDIDVDVDEEPRYSSRSGRPSQIRTYAGAVQSTSSDSGYDDEIQGHVKPRQQGYDGDVTSDARGHVKPREQGYTGDVTSEARGHVKPREQGYTEGESTIRGHVNPSVSDTSLSLPAWTDLETTYRGNYDSMYAARGSYTWDQYSPAYRYGYNLASDRRYTDRGWADIEMDARRQWEMENEGTWQDFKDAVRYGWEQVKDAVGAGGYDAGVDDSSDEHMHRR